MPATGATAAHANSKPRPAVQHSYRLTTPEEQHIWGVQWWWRKCRLIGACPRSQQTYADMMRRNRKALGK